MKNKGFTLVELLAVIAILAILVIIALPNVLSMFNNAKKDIFLTQAKNIYKEVSKKYISETMKGNRIAIISNNENKLDVESNNLNYEIKLDKDGNIKKFQVSDETYCLSGRFKNLSELTSDKIKDGKCEEDSPISFTEDDWSTIIEAVRNNNTDKYNVGDTKEIDMGSYGTHTLRIANKSTPSECSTSGFSQTACGFVLEFADVILSRSMNPSGTYDGKYYQYGLSKGGWPATNMRVFINNDLYNALPFELRSKIIDTTAISSYGSADVANFTSVDKLYLLAPSEIYSNFSDSGDHAIELTRQLDYYKNLSVTTTNFSGAKKNSWWWLRSASSESDLLFYVMYSNGSWGNIGVASLELGVSPAFRIG